MDSCHRLWYVYNHSDGYATPPGQMSTQGAFEVIVTPIQTLAGLVEGFFCPQYCACTEAGDPDHEPTH